MKQFLNYKKSTTHKNTTHKKKIAKLYQNADAFENAFHIYFT